MRIFKEEQLFIKSSLMVLIIISLIAPISIITAEYYSENSNMSTKEFILTILFILVCILPIFFFKLKTRIDEKGIHYQFFPFHFSLRLIKWLDIEKAYVRAYSPISEYGGWGIKGGAIWSKSKGKAINISGDVGIQLKLKNGKKLLIGTQKKEDAIKVLNTYKNKLI